jgi:hypothetical protein
MRVLLGEFITTLTHTLSLNREREEITIHSIFEIGSI